MRMVGSKLMSIIDVHTEHGFSRQEPTSIIIHAMGEYISGSNWENHAVQFLNKIGLSAHSLIAPKNTKGEVVNYRLRNDNEGAYHAKRFNKDSLGMEFLVAGQHDYASFLEAIKTDYLTEGQFQLGLSQVREWLNIWPITSIKRHSDVSPERKVDPGEGFPWQDFLNDIGTF